MAADLVAEKNLAFCGRPGVLGQRAANIIQQKADRLYVFGARMDEAQRAFSWDIAPNAEKIVFDIDYHELMKFPKDWQVRNQDLSEPFMPYISPIPQEWLMWCKDLYKRFRPELDGDEFNDPMSNPNSFISMLSAGGQPDDIFVTGSGSAGETFMQCFRVREDQRIITLSTNGAMGSDIPLAVGACVASGKRVICVTGDGGMSLNQNELEVAYRLKLPLTVFVFTNGGYGSIRNSQRAWFGRTLGCDEESGFTMPSIPLEYVGMIKLIYVDPEWKQYPRVLSHDMIPDRFEDMTPKLPADELKVLMEWGNG